MTSDCNLCKCYLSAWVVFPGELKCPQPEFLRQPPANTGFTDTLGLVTASALPHPTCGPWKTETLIITAAKRQTASSSSWANLSF